MRFHFIHCRLFSRSFDVMTPNQLGISSSIVFVSGPIVAAAEPNADEKA